MECQRSATFIQFFQPGCQIILHDKLSAFSVGLFFLNGNCTQTPSSSPIPSKQYEAPKLSQNTCTLTLHCFCIIVSNLFKLNFSQVVTGYLSSSHHVNEIYKHLGTVWYFGILHIFRNTNPKYLIWFTTLLIHYFSSSSLCLNSQSVKTSSSLKSIVKMRPCTKYLCLWCVRQFHGLS